jgi:hypothetical protein
VREPIALKRIIEIAVCVQVENAELGMARPDGTEHRVAYRMISSEYEWTPVRLQNLANGRLDRVSDFSGARSRIRHEVSLIV